MIQRRISAFPANCIFLRRGSCDNALMSIISKKSSPSERGPYVEAQGVYLSAGRRAFAFFSPFARIMGIEWNMVAPVLKEIAAALNVGAVPLFLMGRDDAGNWRILGEDPALAAEVLTRAKNDPFTDFTVPKELRGRLEAF